jgi:membrane protein CcdC involved in cytochrome C biogenesis
MTMLLFIRYTQILMIQQNEGIGNLMGMALLALCVITLFIVALKIKNKRLQPEEKKIFREKKSKESPRKFLIK